jgi:hypothetical protein
MVGAQWRWSGEVVRVDGPAELLVLDGGAAEADMRRRAAKVVRRLIGAAVTGREFSQLHEDDTVPEQGFVVTDGNMIYAISVIEMPETSARLLMFTGAIPPRNTDLWVVNRTVDRGLATPGTAEATGVICFTPGTRITTPDGPRLIEDIRPGDRVSTRDNGAQQVMWSGHRRMTGARLFAMPHLRPIRIRAGAMGEDRPESDLIVSPRHRMLVRGAAVQSLFNTPEVLVAAADLLNHRSVHVESNLREVTYFHLLTERHQIVWANGLETESFHPANAALDMIDPAQRESLLALMPELAHDPALYGDHARRNLAASEAAILRFDAA